MKKRTFILLFLITIFTVNFVSAQKKIRVKNVDEFVNAIGSDVIIELEYGLYDLASYSAAYNSELDPYGQSAYYIENRNNLIIKGIGDYPSEIIVSNDEYAVVLFFKNCQNITLENVEVGHGASQGSCTGSVIGLSGTNGVNIKKCVLYGSGTYGIESYESSSDLICENTTIRSCTYGALSLIGFTNAVFNKCTFTDNDNLDIFYIKDCQRVVFNSCVIKDNTNRGTGEYGQYSSNKLFYVEGEAVTLNNCMVKFNRVDYLANTRNALKINNSFIEQNILEKGEFEN